MDVDKEKIIKIVKHYPQDRHYVLAALQDMHKKKDAIEAIYKEL